MSLHPATPRQDLRQLHLRLIQLAADAVRLRTEGEPVRGCDSQVLDVRLCQLALDIRAVADQISHHHLP